MNTEVPRKRRSRSGVLIFVGLMMVVVGIQGTYLGYVVGILTTLEKRFGFTSEKSGFLLAAYDFGHTVAILLAGYFGAKGHLPRITGIGVLLSGLSMLVLVIPAIIFRFNDSQEDLMFKMEKYARDFRCDSDRIDVSDSNCNKEHEEHVWAFVILCVGQFLAGVFAAPFNTLAYVYIDNNVEDRRQSPFLLGLLTSMYAFGPALGFALSSVTTRIYTTLGEPPQHISMYSTEWIGAWWVGFLLCSVLYLLCAAPFFFFPISYDDKQEVEMRLLKQPHLPPASISGEEETPWQAFVKKCKDFPYVVADLCANPVFVSMVVGWTFGSYLIGGYTTYLPKYIETQYGRSASAADFYSGFISVGAVAVSTAIGGWLLTRFDIGPRKGILLLIGSWTCIVATYIAGTFVGCDQSNINGLQFTEYTNKWSFFDAYAASCSDRCRCSSVMHFDPVNFDGENFYSPCHAGCTTYDERGNQWSNCECAGWNRVEGGLVHPECPQIYAYLSIMFVGLFAGNLFFMVTMMIVLRSVYDDQKVVALSFASFFTNLFGFIPAPVLLGWIVDKACILWHNRCPNDGGNCVLYDNAELRVSFHLSSASLQAVAILAVFVCYLFARRNKFPEEEDNYVYEPPTPIER